MSEPLRITSLEWKPVLNRTHFPYYHLVPKTIRENLAFRRKVMRLGRESASEAKALVGMCRRDPLFWINSFVWTFDPRVEPFPVLPFITYPFQDGIVLELLLAIGNYSLHVNKSRGVGFSWLTMLLYDHFCTFDEYQAFLLISQKEMLVDDPGNPDSLMYKLDFTHEHLPAWLRPAVDPRKLHRSYEDTGSVIDGAATTSNAGRAGRRKSVLGDEFAHVADDEPGKDYLMVAALSEVTNSVIYGSTPNGPANAFADLRRTNVRSMLINWRSHPVKMQNSYKAPNGQIRSPWYDNKCDELMNSPQLIAAELENDYLGSSPIYFDAPVIDRLINETALPPMHVGRLEYDPQTAMPSGFIDSELDSLKLWIDLDPATNRPPASMYVAGCDVAVGTPDSKGRGASNSTISVYDIATAEKAAEYACSTISPSDFAHLAVALCRWFRFSENHPGAFLIWELNGPGRDFGRHVTNDGYTNVWRKRQEDAISRRISDVPGWVSTIATKMQLFGIYKAALNNGTIVNRSRRALEECLEYVILDGGNITHERSKSARVPTEGRELHGDRVIADALCALVLSERRQVVKAEEKRRSEYCFAARHPKCGLLGGNGWRYAMF